MKRLTKQVSLVLVSSSLVLHGCGDRGAEQRRERLAEQRKQLAEIQRVEEAEGGANFEQLPPEVAAATSDTHQGGTHRTHFFPWFVRTGPTGVAPGVGYPRTPGSPASGFVSGSRTTTTQGGPRATPGGSIRGGFGGSGHSAVS